MLQNSDFQTSGCVDEVFSYSRPMQFESTERYSTTHGIYSPQNRTLHDKRVASDYRTIGILMIRNLIHFDDFSYFV